MQAKLVMIVDEEPSEQYELELPTIIGRSRNTDLRLVHPLVSRQHCEVFEANGLLMVRDLGSLNGTFVGELRITEAAAPIRPGELLTVGPVTFRADYRAIDRQSKLSTWNTDGPTLDSPLPGVDDMRDTRSRPQRRDEPEDDAPPGK